MSGFKQFLLRGNIVELAVAVIIGATFSGLVQAFVSDLVTPLIGAVTGGRQPNFADYSFTINGSRFKYGDFLNHLISFLLISAIVYWLIVAPMAKVIRLFDRDKAGATKQCPECLSDIPTEARRCAHCTSELVPESEKPR
ncbi:large conductance mechanosensitive channel protein MscL [Nonomuraea sp. 3N208]|uniref:large conductance mechanosensitive channel protein MscL n=1 Tax=Nonomuraea sp. 3N208 TaxID=3457421 RepID=UPI003FCE1E7A